MGTITNVIIVCIGISAVALLIWSKIRQARGHGGCHGNCSNCSNCNTKKQKKQE